VPLGDINGVRAERWCFWRFAISSHERARNLSRRLWSEIGWMMASSGVNLAKTQLTGKCWFRVIRPASIVPEMQLPVSGRRPDLLLATAYSIGSLESSIRSILVFLAGQIL